MKFSKQLAVLRQIYWFGRHLTNRGIANFNSYRYDRKLGIETSRVLDRTELGVEADKRKHAWSYHPCDTRRFSRVMRHLKIDFERFCFIDVGSGKGRVLFMASELPFNRLIGVEFSIELNRIAESNLKRFAANSSLAEKKIELVCCDALELELPREPTVLFLFNPFDGEIMAKFIQGLENSLKFAPRPTIIIYVHPTAEEVFQQSANWRLVIKERRKDDFVIYSFDS